MTKKKKITVLIIVLAIVLVGALSAVIIACNISNANEKSVNTPQTEVSTVNVTEKRNTEATQSTVQSTTENNKTETTTPNTSANTTSKSRSDSKPKKSSTTASSSGSKDKKKSSSSKKSTKSTTSSKSTTKKSETTKKTPYWCDEGGSHHVIDEGHGWYKSYQEAERAALANISSTTYCHYEVQECDCGLFTYYYQ